MNPNIHIRPIKFEDNEAIKTIVLQVLKEYGAEGDGFASADPELECMFETYQSSGSRYWVVELEGNIVGGAGIGPLKNESKEHCELQKMYILNRIRGHGIGKKLIQLCLEFARNQNFEHCYLETLPEMRTAQHLYLKFGFNYLDTRMGGTGHSKCPVFMLYNI